jgi:pyruvate dehydrogenase E2 component (dihydrolipoamide acetyltransferase)
MDVTLPPLAEGAESGTVVSVLVSVGDEIKVDQSVVEIENEKAIAPIPSPGAGKVTAIHVKEGDTVAVGQKMITIGGGKTEAPKKESAPVPAASTPAPQHVAQPQTVTVQTPVAAAPVGQYQYQSPSGFPPPASPSVRRLAAEIGLDLTRIPGSENGGRIVLNDIKAYIQTLQQRAFAPVQAVQLTAPAAAGSKYQPQSIDFSKWGSVTSKPYASVRKTIGSRMHEAWSTIPHVYQLDEADITQLMAFRNKHKDAYKKAGAGLTLTAIAVKVVANALQKFQMFNASLDEVKEEVILKNYFNIAIAVDTDAGLVVPVIRDADQKELLTIAKELGTIAVKARDRKLSAEDMEGSTFTISNLGGIGGTHFTPIIKKPDAAILGIGKGMVRPAFNGKNKIEARTIMPLCVSYDHRIIDGADGARFITELVNGFESVAEADIKLSASSSSAKKSTAKKSTIQKATSKKAAAKSATAKKSTTKKGRK